MAQLIDVGIQQRESPNDHGHPQRDLENPDAVGDLLVAPFGQAAVDLVQLAVDAGLDLIELLVEVFIGRSLDAPGDPAEKTRLLDLFLDRWLSRRLR